MSKSALQRMFLCTRRSEAEALFLRAETVSGLGGRRGFYSRSSGMSTTFSDKKRFFQLFEKSLNFQRVLCQPKAFGAARADVLRSQRHELIDSPHRLQAWIGVSSTMHCDISLNERRLRVVARDRSPRGVFKPLSQLHGAQCVVM
jgi:hypothetical protein